MGIREQLDQDLKRAMRSGDKLRSSVIRLLASAIKNREVEKRTQAMPARAEGEVDARWESAPDAMRAEVERRGALTEEEILQVMASACKQRRDAIEQFRHGGREDLASKEEAELRVLEGYLPQPLTEGEIQARVAEAIAAAQAKSVKDMGKVMAIVMPQVAGRADGKIVSTMVREALAKGG